MEPLTTDEIIDEIHAIRLEHSTRFDFDMERILADLKQSEQAHTEQGWPLIHAQEMPLPSETQTHRIRFARR